MRNIFLIILFTLFIPMTTVFAENPKYHIEYVEEVNEEILFDFGFKVIEVGIYRCPFKEYDKEGNYVRTSYIYIVVRKIFV